MNLDYKYEDYLFFFTEEQRSEYDFLVEFGRVNGEPLKEMDYMSNVDFTDREFGFVKECIELINNNKLQELFEKIFELPEYQTIYEIPAYQAILTIRFLINRLVQLIKIENEMLVSQFPNDYSLQIDTINFSAFTQEYIQTDSLAKGDITKYEIIRKLPYRECFVKLLYDFKNDELEKSIMRLKAH